MDGGRAPSGIGHLMIAVAEASPSMLMFAVWTQTSCHNEIRFVHLPVLALAYVHRHTIRLI